MSTTTSSDQTPPPTPSVQDILYAYSRNMQLDKEILIAILKAQAAEDQRVAALASLSETCLAYAMHAQQEQNSTTSVSRVRVGGTRTTTVHGSMPLTPSRTSFANESTSGTVYGNYNSRLPCTSPGLTFSSPPTDQTSWSRARAPTHANASEDSRGTARPWPPGPVGHQQNNRPAISLPPISAVVPWSSHRHNILAIPSGSRLPPADNLVLACPVSQHKPNIQNLLSANND